MLKARILYIVLGVLLSVLFFSPQAKADSFTGGGGGAGGQGCTNCGTGSNYKWNSVVGPGSSSQHSISNGPSTKYGLTWLTNNCTTANVNALCSDSVLRQATTDFFNDVRWYNPTPDNTYGGQLLGGANCGMISEGDQYISNSTSCIRSKSEIARSGQGFAPSSGNVHGQGPNNPVNPRAGQIVAVNLRVWRLRPSGQCDPSCGNQTVPILDKTVTTGTGLSWWRGGYKEPNNGPYYGIGKTIVSTYNNELRNQQDAWRVCKKPKTDGTCLGNGNEYYDTPGPGNNGETIKFRTKISSSGGMSYSYNIDGPRGAIYLIQVVGLDSRETVIQQGVAVYTKKIQPEPTQPSCPPEQTCCEPGDVCTGEPTLMTASSDTVETMVEDQTRNIDVQASYQGNNTAAFSSAVPRNVTLFYSRGTTDPNRNKNIMNDHEFNGTPFNSSQSTGATNQNASHFNLFQIKGAGTSWVNQGAGTNAIPVKAINGQFDLTDMWNANFRETVKSSTPQQIKGDSFDSGYQPTDEQKKQTDELQTGIMRYESRYVNLNGIKDNTVFYDGFRDLTSDWDGRKEDYFKIPPGSVTNAVGLGSYHYQPRDGKFEAKLGDGTPDYIRNNVIGVAIMNRSDFPNVREADFATANNSGSELNICRTPNRVKNYQYSTSYRVRAVLYYSLERTDGTSIPATEARFDQDLTIGTVTRSIEEWKDRENASGEKMYKIIPHYKAQVVDAVSLSSITPSGITWVDAVLPSNSNQKAGGFSRYKVSGVYQNDLPAVSNAVGADLPLWGTSGSFQNGGQTVNYAPGDLNLGTGGAKQKLVTIPDYYFKTVGYDYGQAGQNGSPNLRDKTRSELNIDAKYVKPGYSETNVPDYYDSYQDLGMVYDRWHRDDCDDGVSNADNANNRLTWVVGQGDADYPDGGAYAQDNQVVGGLGSGAGGAYLPQGEYYVIWFYAPTTNAPQQVGHWRPQANYWQPDANHYQITSYYGEATVPQSLLQVYASRTTG